MTQTSPDRAQPRADGAAAHPLPDPSGRPDGTLLTEPRPAGTTVVRVEGDVDLLTSPAVRDRVDAGLATRPDLLVLDLSRVEFLSSSGLALLVDVRAAAQRQGARLQLVTTGRVVLRPLTATGLAPLFDVVDTPPAG